LIGRSFKWRSHQSESGEKSVNWGKIKKVEERNNAGVQKWREHVQIEKY
jgi:hypothetical protein